MIRGNKVMRIFHHPVLKSLTAIYPGYLMLLVFSPLIVGYFIDPDLMDPRTILIDLAWVPLFTIPAIIFRKNIFYRLADFFYFLFGFIEIAHWIILKGPVTLTSLLIISNTNLQESVEFFNLKASWGLLLLIPFIALYVLSFKESAPLLLSRIEKYTLATVLLFSIVFIGENILHGRLIRKGVPPLVKTAFSFADKIKLYEQAMEEGTPKDIEAESLTDACQTFVLILGESCNRNHMSVYGYDRETTPRLEHRDDIIVFDNIIAAYSNTLNSVLSMLSESNLDNKKELKNSTDIIDVFHSAGFRTYWISNQSPIGVWDNLVTVFANKSDHKRFVNISSNSSFEATYTPSYDSKLFKPFIWALADSAKKKFIVLHLMGSHSSYSRRYPDKFNLFKGSHSKERTIAQYDNSILYNDFIVDSLITILHTYSSAENNTVSAAIYLSDHGENVYDEGNRAGHDYSKILPKANVEVPFIVWLSEYYKNKYPEKAKSMKENIHTPFVTDDLFYTIIDMNFIETPFSDNRRSLFNPAFDTTRKRVLEDGKDYDNK